MNNYNYEHIFANQYDEGRIARISITENDVVKDLTGLQAVFTMAKPDGTKVLNTCEIEDNKVIVVITIQMTAYSGESPYQITLQRGDVTISTVCGSILVEPAAVPNDAIPSGDEMSILNTVMQYTTEARSWTKGDTDTRPGEESDNAYYYYDQTRRLFNGVDGVTPMGSIFFSELATVTRQKGFMYNIKDDFVSTAEFNDGGGERYPAGTNIVYVVDEGNVGKWDALAGVNVVGVKGANEQHYRVGEVNITKGDIGLADGINVVCQDDEPTDGEDVWIQPYTPSLEPSPIKPRYNDNVFFTVSDSDGHRVIDIIPNHLVSDSVPIAFKKSPYKRGCPVRTQDSGFTETLYLDFEVCDDDTETVWWWTSSGELHMNRDIVDVLLSNAYYYLDWSGIHQTGYMYPSVVDDSSFGFATVDISNATIETEMFPNKILVVTGVESAVAGTNFSGKVFNNSYLVQEEVNVSNLDLSECIGSVSALGTVSGYDLEEEQRVSIKVNASNWIIPQKFSDRYIMDTDSLISEIQVTDWDLSNCTDISWLFQGSDFENTKIIGLDTWDVSNITNMAHLFDMTTTDHTLLADIDFSGWDVSNVTNMAQMFAGVSGSEEYPSAGFPSTVLSTIASWNVSSVEDFSYMFSGTGYNVTDFSFLNNWTPNSNANFTGILCGCTVDVYPTWNGFFADTDPNSSGYGGFYPYAGSHQYPLHFRGQLTGTLPDNLPSNPQDGDAYLLIDYDPNFAVYFDGYQGNDVWRLFDDDTPVNI